MGAFLIFIISWAAIMVLGMVVFFACFPTIDTVTGIMFVALIGWIIAFIFALLHSKYSEPSNDASSGPAPTPDKKKYINGAVNHFKNGIADGGRLWLLPDAMEFRPHALNLHRDTLRIPYGEISDVQSGSFNTILVVLKNSTSETFVVHGKQKWIDDIKRMITA